jgi:hypothetical protein
MATKTLGASCHFKPCFAAKQSLGEISVGEERFLGRMRSDAERYAPSK